MKLIVFARGKYFLVYLLYHLFNLNYSKRGNDGWRPMLFFQTFQIGQAQLQMLEKSGNIYPQKFPRFVV